MTAQGSRNFVCPGSITRKLSKLIPENGGKGQKTTLLYQEEVGAPNAKRIPFLFHDKTVQTGMAVFNNEFL